VPSNLDDAHRPPGPFTAGRGPHQPIVCAADASRPTEPLLVPAKHPAEDVALVGAFADTVRLAIYQPFHDVEDINSVDAELEEGMVLRA
jgi:hypothetical protein